MKNIQYRMKFFPLPWERCKIFLPNFGTIETPNYFQKSSASATTLSVVAKYQNVSVERNTKEQVVYIKGKIFKILLIPILAT